MSRVFRMLKLDTIQKKRRRSSSNSSVSASFSTETEKSPPQTPITTAKTKQIPLKNTPKKPTTNKKMWTLTLGHFMSDWNILINLDQVHTNHTPDLWLPCKKHDGKRACRLNRMPSLPLSPIARTDRYLKSESFTYSWFLHTHTHTHIHMCVCTQQKQNEQIPFKKNNLGQGADLTKVLQLIL